MTELDSRLNFGDEKMDIFTNMIFYKNGDFLKILKSFKQSVIDIDETENSLDSIALRILDSRKNSKKHILKGESCDLDTF